MSRTPPHGFVIAAGLALGLANLAQAQDSTATAAGLPGDALDAYKVTGPSEQVNNYVVDLSDRPSSWGGHFSFGPIAKSSRSATSTFFNHLIGAQAVSSRFERRSLLRPSYQAWIAAGQGINNTSNGTPVDNGSGDYGTLTTVNLLGYRFGAAFMEFAGGNDGVFGSGDDENNIIVSMIDFPLRRPNRLFVSRINALSNKLTNSSGNSATASLGLGGVDDTGAVAVLADGYGILSPNRIANKQYVRVNAAARDATRVNRIQQGSLNDAPNSSVVRDSTVNLTTPTYIPSAIATRPVMLGLDLASNALFEGVAGSLTSTRTFLPGSAGFARGNVSYVPQTFVLTSNGVSDAGTAAVLARTNSDTTTRALNVWGVNLNGSVDSALQFVLPTIPAQIVDPVDGFSPGAVFAPLSAHEFTSYQSQVGFRGGNGQVAMTTTFDGDLLLAALVTETGSAASLPQGENNYIAVCRVDHTTGAPSWSVAAHTGNAAGAAGNLSKAILGDFGNDGIPGTLDAGEGDGVIDAAPIGRIALFSEVSPGAGHGPSISAPAFDRYGNLYFTATVRLNRIGGPVFATALLRANFFAGTNGFQLELMLATGDVIAGANSTRNYQVQFLGVADGDSADSGAVWSSSTVQSYVPGVVPESLPFASPVFLGALSFRARIVYDVNQDGQYIDPSQPGNTGPDQGYNVQMIAMPTIRIGDFDRNGEVNSNDVSTFLNRWFEDLGAGTFNADWNGDGEINSNDVTSYLNDWFANLV